MKTVYLIVFTFFLTSCDKAKFQQDILGPYNAKYSHGGNGSLTINALEDEKGLYFDNWRNQTNEEKIRFSLDRKKISVEGQVISSFYSNNGQGNFDMGDGTVTVINHVLKANGTYKPSKAQIVLDYEILNGESILESGEATLSK